MSRNLIIYYSRRGQNYVGGSIVNLARGNTELVVGYIADAVGADLFEVVTAKPYSEDYTACTEEQRPSSAAMPAQSSGIIFRIFPDTIALRWPAPAGGAPIPAVYSLSWKSWTSLERGCFL